MQNATAIYSRRKFGRLYQVAKYKGDLILTVNGLQNIQSYGTHGMTGLYYDEIAKAIPNTALDILILVCAGGTIARLYRLLGGQGKITAVDNDLEIIKIGRKFFALDQYIDNFVLVNAKIFVKVTQMKFDVVIDDLYKNALEKEFCDASRLVRKGGLYITNGNYGKVSIVKI